MHTLISALREVLRAEHEEESARQSYDGYEWGYHGFEYAERSRKANEKLEKELTTAIDERVSAILDSRNA